MKENRAIGSAGANARLKNKFRTPTGNLTQLAKSLQNTADLVTAAKTLYTKAKGEKAQFEIVAPRQRGPFVDLLRGTVDVTVR